MKPLFASIALFAALSVRGNREAAFPADERPFSVLKDVYPFLKKHCVSCHNGVTPRAERSLTDYQDAASIRRDFEAWSEIVKSIESNTMPPASSPRPKTEEVNRFLENVRRVRGEKPAEK